MSEQFWDEVREETIKHNKPFISSEIRKKEMEVFDKYFTACLTGTLSALNGQYNTQALVELAYLATIEALKKRVQ